MQHEHDNPRRFRLSLTWITGMTLLTARATVAVALPPYAEKPLTEEGIKVSDHVWAIIGFPNIGIVIGQKATLVVDTGLGRENGATVARVAAKSWIAAVEEVGKLGPQHVLPDHSPVGSGSLVGEERAFLIELRDRAVALKGEGMSAERAGQQLTAEFEQQYPDWKIDDLTSFVKGAYADDARVNLD